MEIDDKRNRGPILQGADEAAIVRCRPSPANGNANQVSELRNVQECDISMYT